MTVQELINKLLTMPQDLQVYSVCDHGQSAEKSQYPSIGFTNKDAECLWDEYTTDEDDAQECGYTQKVVIL